MVMDMYFKSEYGKAVVNVVTVLGEGQFIPKVQPCPNLVVKIYSIF